MNSRQQGTCERCQAAIPKRDKFCKPCLIEVRAEQERIKLRREANIKGWRTPAGEWIETPILKAHTRRTIVFETHFMAQVNLNSCGGVLDGLVGLCFSRPKYLDIKDAARYVALLNEFQEFKFSSWRLKKEAEIKVAHAPVELLGEALQKWIVSFFKKDCHPLMPAYALDMAEFIAVHLGGFHSMDPESWEIKAIVPGDSYKFFESLHDRGFKKDFTERFGGTLVRCTVPSNSSVKCQDKELIHSGQKFCASIKRCHLSTNFYDTRLLTCDLPKQNPQTLDLGFSFMGEVLLTAEGSLFNWGQDPKRFPIKPLLVPEDLDELRSTMQHDLDFPAEWIDAAWDRKQKEWQPVPQWDAEFG